MLRSAAMHNIARVCGVLRHEPPRTLSQQLAARFRLTCPTSPTCPTAAIYTIARVCGVLRHEPPTHTIAVAGNIASSWRVLQGESRGSVLPYSTEAKDALRRGGQYCEQLASFTRKEPKECTSVLDRGERRSKARQMPQDCPPISTLRCLSQILRKFSGCFRR